MTEQKGQSFEDLLLNDLFVPITAEVVAALRAGHMNGNLFWLTGRTAYSYTTGNANNHGGFEKPSEVDAARQVAHWEGETMSATFETKLRYPYNPKYAPRPQNALALGMDVYDGLVTSKKYQGIYEQLADSYANDLLHRLEK